MVEEHRRSELREVVARQGAGTCPRVGPSAPHAALASIQIMSAACPAPAAAAQKISASVQRTPPPPMCSSVSMLAWCSAATCRLPKGDRTPVLGEQHGAHAGASSQAEHTVSWQVRLKQVGHETDSSSAGSAAGPCAKLCQAAQGAAGTQVATTCETKQPLLTAEPSFGHR